MIQINANEPNNSWIVTMAFWFSLILFIGGFIFFGFNTYFSAIGTVELTGGSVNYLPNVDGDLIPNVQIVDGGLLGISFGLILGLVANSFQFMAFVLRDKDILGDKFVDKTWITSIDISLRTYDILTTFWFLSYGFTFNGETDPVKLWITGITILIISVLVFSVGSEFIMALGVRLLFKYGGPGFRSTIETFVSIIKIIGEGYSKLSEGLSGLGERDDNPRGQNSGQKFQNNERTPDFSGNMGGHNHRQNGSQEMQPEFIRAVMGENRDGGQPNNKKKGPGRPTTKNFNRDIREYGEIE